MTRKEFMAWLEGFEEGFDEAPSPEQWRKIRAKFDTVEDIVATKDLMMPNVYYRSEPSPSLAPPQGFYQYTTSNAVYDTVIKKAQLEAMERHLAAKSQDSTT